ncbi:hypothetical protein UK23_00395 [Lentzea aerocolonigenes]|uniref:Uncharacterized protein n=1 Tax=Lentzea aerocolonigenes TaxID=68170 RepID=A0A0F0HF01_LENAE|nr:hypothetical protein [Lentzea aerocolonigenes]KJK53416.1 hypothetical protein UK23_00395 [Lentzea aerocolonigenes]
MYPTVTVEHLASVATATDDSDDMKIYEFDHDASIDILIGVPWSSTSPGGSVVRFEEVLAA